MTRMTAVAALVLAAACGGAAPPEDGPAPQGPGGPGGPELTRMGGGPPSVFALIGAREQLGLTGAQVTTLDSINRVWSARNDSLRRQLRNIEERRSAVRMERARPLLVGMAQNNQWAGSAVETLLTEEQRRIACTIPQAQSGDRRRTGAPAGTPARRGGMRPPPGTAADTIPGMRMRRGWPWCGPEVPADSAR